MPEICRFTGAERIKETGESLGRRESPCGQKRQLGTLIWGTGTKSMRGIKIVLLCASYAPALDRLPPQYLWYVDVLIYNVSF